MKKQEPVEVKWHGQTFIKQTYAWRYHVRLTTGREIPRSHVPEVLRIPYIFMVMLTAYPPSRTKYGCHLRMMDRMQHIRPSTDRAVGVTCPTAVELELAVLLASTPGGFLQVSHGQRADHHSKED